MSNLRKTTCKKARKDPSKRPPPSPQEPASDDISGDTDDPIG